MTYIEPSRTVPRNAFSTPDAPTLEDVFRRLASIDNIDDRYRGELRSAVRTVGRVLDRALSELPAHPRFLRERLKKVVPVASGLTDTRWRNVRSLLRKALEVTGIPVLPGRHLAPLTSLWQQRYSSLPSRKLRIGLSRLFHYCSANGILPEEITAVIFDEFRNALERESLLADPRTVHREACRCWNLAAEQVDGWPKVRIKVPDYRNWYILDWQAFPPSLEADVETMLDTAQAPRLTCFSRRKTLKTTSSSNFRYRSASKIFSIVISTRYVTSWCVHSRIGYSLEKAPSIREKVS